MTESDKKVQIPWWRDSVLMFTQMSAWIAFPVIAGVFLGSWLDSRYNTKPWLFLLTIGLAFVISMIGIVRQANEAIQKINQSNKITKDKTKDEFKD